MKKFVLYVYLLVGILLLFHGMPLLCQTLPGAFTTTWSGNTLSGKNDWVQGYMLTAAVNGEGKVYTMAHWDEAGKTCGIYQNGNAVGRINNAGFAITVNDSNVFAQSGSSVKKFQFNGVFTNQTIAMSFTPSYLAANQAYLVASNNGSNEVSIFSLATGNKTKSWSVKNPGAVSIDENNIIWVVSGVQLPEDRFEHKWLVYDSTYTPRLFKYNETGVKQNDSIMLYKEWRPVCLSHDKNTGQLMVGDDGPKHQVHFFDYTGVPTLMNSFGFEGGISAGDPGIIRPDKFWALKGTGTDKNNNIYVVLGEDGSVIRSLKPSGELNWELNAANFVDAMNFDPYSDGRLLYGKNEIIKMDYDSLTPGTEWSMYAYTQDRTKYPADPRNFYTSLGHDFTSMWPRIIEGDLYMFSSSMYGIQPNVFKFDGKVASPAAYLKLNGSIAFYQDKQGNVWEANGSGIIRTPLITIEKNGDLIYGNTEKVSDIPAPFTSVARIIFDEDHDVMYLSGCDGTSGGCDHIGNTFARYDHWSKGNRTANLTGVISWSDGYNNSMAVAGDYVFFCGGTTKSRIKVYSAVDFSYKGMMEAGDIVGGPENTGWVDIPYGLNAFKRSNGEYIVVIEDDYKMKNVIFRWCPNGSCKQGAPTVHFDGLINKTSILPNGSLTIQALAEDKNGTIDSIQLYADTVLLASSNNASLAYTWNNISEGKYYLQAKAYDNDGLTAVTYPYRIYAENPDTEKPTSPLNFASIDTGTTYVTFNWNKSTDNKGLAGYKIYRDGQVAYVSGGTDTVYKALGLAPNTSYKFKVVAFDKALNLSDESNEITVQTLSDGPYLGSPITIPGKIEAEDFDFGGEGVAYHDAQPENLGGAMRKDEGVDLATAGDGNFYIGWTEINEWQRYTIDVKKEADYDIIIRTAGGSGTLTLTFANGNKEYTISYPSTTDWDIWTMSSKTSVHLLPGVQYLNVNMNNASFNLDYIKIIEHDTIAPSTPLDLRVGAINGKSLTLNWSSSTDNGGIKEYQIFGNDVKIGSCATNTITLNSLNYSQAYKIVVKAVDFAGNQSEESNEITVTLNAPPKVNIVTSAFNSYYALDSTIDVEINASDDVSVAKVELYLNDVLREQKTDAPYNFSLIGLLIGSYKIKAIAYDDQGLTAISNIVSFKVYNASGIKSLNSSGNFIYPNPVSDGSFTITHLEGKTTVCIIDPSGRVLYNKSIIANHNLTINDASLTSGIYILLVKNNGAESTYKLVIQ
jgi:chitodextrinase